MKTNRDKLERFLYDKVVESEKEGKKILVKKMKSELKRIIINSVKAKNANTEKKLKIKRVYGNSYFAMFYESEKIGVFSLRFGFERRGKYNGTDVKEYAELIDFEPDYFHITRKDKDVYFHMGDMGRFNILYNHDDETMIFPCRRLRTRPKGVSKEYFTTKMANKIDGYLRNIRLEKIRKTKQKKHETENMRKILESIT